MNYYMSLNLNKGPGKEKVNKNHNAHGSVINL